jgi:hypothetical protein
MFPVVSDQEPCILTILPEHIEDKWWNANPILLSVMVEGNLKIGAILCTPPSFSFPFFFSSTHTKTTKGVPSKSYITIGRVTAIRRVVDRLPVTTAATGQVVVIKVEPKRDRENRVYLLGRDFDTTDQFFTKITNLSQLKGLLERDVPPWLHTFIRVMKIQS